jgi:hypothetical protein
MRAIRSYMIGPLWLEPCRDMVLLVPDRVWEQMIDRQDSAERDAQFWMLTRETILRARRDL